MLAWNATKPSQTMKPAWHMHGVNTNEAFQKRILRERALGSWPVSVCHLLGAFCVMHLYQQGPLKLKCNCNSFFTLGGRRFSRINENPEMDSGLGTPDGRFHYVVHFWSSNVLLGSS